ncbi:DUF4112 domain-containing protein [Leptolyngbya sp. FACHB-711]|uniref:DUF4112 domain-containing protein n=1 Tax=unclassified Leptolyngbya TaxID=2650499 RepID=UPI001687959A|nr:DUF4112 domain-containing protein [Leptolyngbya sp. FACHB-711]MBD1850074.1 DUF4112 domain-containing protein [Cyanobacteria bacterium FACHB-502]MBD2025413.1 DUF4112 domain-containing protein [Leptolyngbya sp. FACHB-711]
MPPLASASFANRLQRLRQLSHLLDSAIGIPGTKYRIGLDPIIGLVPGGGDTAGLLLSAYIVMEAARLGASKAVLTQMVSNIVLETLVGTVPLVGDFFDATWKSNVRNIRLLEDHLQIVPPGRRSQNRGFALLLLLGLLLIFIACLTVSVLVLRQVFIWLGIG